MFFAKFEIIFAIYLHKKPHIVDASGRLVWAVKLKAKLMPYYSFVAHFTTTSLSLHATRDYMLKWRVTIGFVGTQSLTVAVLSACRSV